MRRPSTVTLVLSALLLTGFSAALNGQRIVVATNPLIFAAQPGAISAIQSVPITTSGGTLPFVIAFTPTSGGQWLTFSPASGTLPATVFIAAKATLLGPGVYRGILTVSSTSGDGSQTSVAVTFDVGNENTSIVSANPTFLNFAAELGDPAPLPQQLSILGATPGAIYSALAATDDGGNWLQFSPTSGSTPTVMTVSTITAGMPAGLYTGSITLTSPSSLPFVVPVTLVITSNSTLSVTTNSLQFNYQRGGAAPVAQGFDLASSSGSALYFSLQPTTTSGGNWLSVNRLTGTTPQTISVAVNTANLSPGVYKGGIAVFPIGATVPVQNIAVTLTVADSPLLLLGASPVPFSFQIGGTLPPSQSVVISSTSDALNFSVSTSTLDGANWLVAGPLAGTTPTSAVIGVNPQGLATGVYKGTVAISSPGAPNSPQSFTIVLTVVAVPTLSLTPATLTFGYQIGGNNALTKQAVAVNTGGPAVPISLDVAGGTCGSAWLQVSTPSLTAPGTFNLITTPQGFTSPRTCIGLLRAIGPGDVGGVQTLVTLNVTGTPQLNVSPSSLNFSAPYGSPISSTQSINISSTNGTPLSFIVNSTTASGGNWISAGPRQGTSAGSVSVSVNPFGLSPGVYTGGVTIDSPGLLTPQTVPLTLTVTPITTMAAKPAVLSFVQAAGAGAPIQQSLSITTGLGNLPVNLTASTTNGFNWLTLTPTTGTTPATSTVTADVTGFPQGAYTGSILVEVPGAKNSPLAVPVTITVAPAQTITATTTALSFSYQLGSTTNPVSQTVGLSTGVSPVSFTTGALTLDSGTWLSVSPASGSTPSSAMVSVNPAGLAAGAYHGLVSILAPGTTGSPILIPVVFNIQGGDITPSGPSITSVANSASGAQGVLSAGAFITIKGTGLGPTAPLMYSAPNASGLVSSTLGGVRVLIDTLPAPLLYVSQTQVNAIVPYEVAGRTNVSVQVENQGIASAAALTFNVADSAPGIFTADSSGSGQAAVFNQDFTPNGPNSPAARGSIVQVFGTGEGATDPPGVTGSIAGSVLKRPLLPVTATINGAPATVVYAGSSPQSPAGLFQVNVRVPDLVPPGLTVPLAIKVGNASSQSGVFIAVQ